MKKDLRSNYRPPHHPQYENSYSKKFYNNYWFDRVCKGVASIGGKSKRKQKYKSMSLEEIKALPPKEKQLALSVRTIKTDNLEYSVAVIENEEYVRIV